MQVLEAGGVVVADSTGSEWRWAAGKHAIRTNGQHRPPQVGRVPLPESTRSRHLLPKTSRGANSPRTRGVPASSGIPSEEVVETSALLRHLKVDGLHAHVGTQMDHTQPFVDLARHLTALAEAIASRTGHLPRILNLGGGLGIPFTDKDRFPSIEAFGTALIGALDRRFEYWFEPGHALVGNAVALLATIVAMKSARGKRWAIADAGTDQLAKITLLDWRHRIRGPDGVPLPATGPDSLGGPLCFSGDTLLPATDVSRLAIGDPILVEHTGAYCASLANTFNGRRAGGTVVIRGDGSVVRTAMPARAAGESLAATHI
ncbi:MAG: hypothetical protein R3C68_17425 [Myxococcota bacterium]